MNNVVICIVLSMWFAMFWGGYCWCSSLPLYLSTSLPLFLPRVCLIVILSKKKPIIQFDRYFIERVMIEIDSWVCLSTCVRERACVRTHCLRVHNLQLKPIINENITSHNIAIFLIPYSLFAVVVQAAATLLLSSILVNCNFTHFN